MENNLAIELHIPDFAKAKKFYFKLGFEMVSEEPIGEQLGYMVLQLGNTRLNFYGGDERVFKQRFFCRFPKNSVRGYGVEITIPVDNIERYYRKVISKIKDSVVQKITLRPWNKKDFRIIDPFGFYIRFTEPVDWSLCYCGSGKKYKRCHGRRSNK